MTLGIIIPCYNEFRRLNVLSFETHLKKINDKELLGINLIDSNPANNPQPPKKNIS